MYQREKTKTVTLIPYEYFNFGKTERVFVIEGNESPDPSKLMLWGRGCKGVVSDFKRYFLPTTRIDPKISLNYKTKSLSAAGENKDMLTAVDEFIKNKCQKFKD